MKSTLEFYIERNGSSKYSKWLFSEAQRRLNLIRSFPELGKVGANDRARILTFSNYGIIYEVKLDAILVISFWDFRRDPDSRADMFE